jgi:hypothetical protein
VLLLRGHRSRMTVLTRGEPDLAGRAGGCSFWPEVLGASAPNSRSPRRALVEEFRTIGHRVVLNFLLGWLAHHAREGDKRSNETPSEGGHRGGVKLAALSASVAAALGLSLDLRLAIDSGKWSKTNSAIRRQSSDIGLWIMRIFQRK